MDDGVGKTLRDARTRRKIDLAEVEASTKIRPRFLRALENEEWDALPGEAYVGGFIRTYAGFLGLDGARLAEQHRRQVGAGRPGERLPRVDVVPVRTRDRRRGPRLPPRALAVVVSLALVAVLLVIGLTSGGDSGMPHHHHDGVAGRRLGGEPDAQARARRSRQARRGLSLRLTATAEVWVCLLDSGGEPLVDGQILVPGAGAGPFRSGSFTVSLGNGEVSMTVNGQQASIPATSSPVGYSIGAGGAVRRLAEGERPTCT